MSNSLFIDIGSCQRQKDGEDCFGDTIYSKKIPEERRVISILSDGLGSGVKANILSSMTTRMAMKFMEDNADLLRMLGFVQIQLGQKDAGKQNLLKAKELGDPNAETLIEKYAK